MWHDTQGNIQFSPGTDKHFTGNAICSSDDSIKQLIHILNL